MTTIQYKEVRYNDHRFQVETIDEQQHFDLEHFAENPGQRLTGC